MAEKEYIERASLMSFENTPIRPMSNIEASYLLVKLYADYHHRIGEDRDYAEAVAKAIAALVKIDLEE